MLMWYVIHILCVSSICLYVYCLCVFTLWLCVCVSDCDSVWLFTVSLSLSLSLSPVSLYPPSLSPSGWLFLAVTKSVFSFHLFVYCCVTTSQQSACVLAYIHVYVRVHILRLPSWLLLLLLFGLLLFFPLSFLPLNVLIRTYTCTLMCIDMFANTYCMLTLVLSYSIS